MQLKENYDALEFVNAPKATFQIEGKDVSCKGYTTTLTEENVDACLDELSEVYDTYNKNTIDDVKTMCKELGLDDEDLKDFDCNAFDSLKDKIDGMPDLDVTFYIYKNRLAAVVVTGTDETGDMELDVEFRGGTTPTQNTFITYGLNGDSGTLKILGKTEDSVEKTKIVDSARLKYCCGSLPNNKIAAPLNSSLPLADTRKLLQEAAEMIVSVAFSVSWFVL